MDSTFPPDLLDLNIRVDHWRITRRFIRETIPTDLPDTINDSLSRHPVSLTKKAVKIDPYRFVITHDIFDLHAILRANDDSPV